MNSRSTAILLAGVVLHSVDATFKTYSGDRVAVSVHAGSVCNVVNFGAKGDGRNNDTAAIQAAIAACSSGSSTVLLPAPYTFLSYPLVIPKVIDFVFEVQGTLVFAPDRSHWTGQQDCIYVTSGSKNIVFTGGGVVNGSGSVWWPYRNDFRPLLLHVESTQGLLISNLTWADSPNHNLELYANDAEVVDTMIISDPDPISHNTDGIDVHGSPFWIHRCYISVGDDNVAMHANDTLVEDCTFGAGHGASIGSLGGYVALKNITVRDATFANTTQAIRIKADQGASGYLTNVTYTNINMTDVGTSIVLTMFYTNTGTGPATNQTTSAPASHMATSPAADRYMSSMGPGNTTGSSTTLKISNVTFANIHAVNSGTAGQFDCDTGSPCEAITLANVQHVGTLSSGWSCQAAYGTADNVSPPACLLPSELR